LSEGVSNYTARVEAITVEGRSGTLRGVVRRHRASEDVPVLFVHPINTRGSCWSEVAERLTPRRDAYLFDLRGHGDSDAHGPYGVDAWTDDCVAVLDRFEVETADVVGGSLGGPIAVNLAALQPNRVRSIVAFGSTLNIEGDGLDDVLGILRERGVRGMFTDVIPQLSVARNTPEVLIQRILADTNPNDVETVSEIWRATLATDVRAIAAKVECPCLIVSGAEDRTCPVKQGLDMARLLRAEHHVLEGVGHLPMYEDPDATAELVTRFTARVGATGAGATPKQ
jgi:3-oxoadipate enol-lactonase